jgi:hypothetical protein
MAVMGQRRQLSFVSIAIYPDCVQGNKKHERQDKLTRIILNASVISHRHDLNIASAIGAFDCGQHAHIH